MATYVVDLRFYALAAVWPWRVLAKKVCIPEMSTVLIAGFEVMYLNSASGVLISSIEKFPEIKHRYRFY